MGYVTLYRSPEQFMPEPEKVPAAGKWIRSAYQAGQQPAIVRNWEKRINAAATANEASAQALYLQLLQLRLIRLILAWALLIIPALVFIAMVILAKIIDFGGTTSRF